MNRGEADDATLVGRVAEGDRVAYAVLVRRYAGRFRAVALQVTKSGTVADDMVQEAFIKLWTRASDFDPKRARFTTWFHRILVNRCLDEQRKRTPDPLPEGFDRADEGPLVSDEMSVADMQSRVRQAIQTLPERQRVAVALTYLDGQSNRDVADTMGLGVKAVESLLVRARKTLRNALAEQRADLLDG